MVVDNVDFLRRIKHQQPAKETGLRIEQTQELIKPFPSGLAQMQVGIEKAPHAYSTTSSS
jgi:hypothetical protein